MEVILSLILLSTIFFIWRWRSEVFDRLEKAKAKIADYEAEIDRKDAEIIAHREQISRLQQKLERSQDEERQKFETRTSQLQTEIQEKIDRKDAEIIAHREQISRLQQRLERSQDEERQKFKTRTSQLQTEIQEKIDRKDAEIIAHREQISRLQRRLERSQDEERQKFETRIDELQAEVQEKQLITALFEEALSINGQLQSDKKQLQREKDELRDEKETEIKQLQRDKHNLQQQVHGLRHGISRGSENLLDLVCTQRDLYEDEKKDILMDLFRNLMSKAVSVRADSRRGHILQDIINNVNNNCSSGRRGEIYGEVETLLKGYTGMNQQIENRLDSLGISVRRGGHHQLVFCENNRYKITIAGTPRDREKIGRKIIDDIRDFWL